MVYRNYHTLFFLFFNYLFTVHQCSKQVFYITVVDSITIRSIQSYFWRLNFLVLSFIQFRSIHTVLLLKYLIIMIWKSVRFFVSSFCCIKENFRLIVEKKRGTTIERDTIGQSGLLGAFSFTIFRFVIDQSCSLLDFRSYYFNLADKFLSLIYFSSRTETFFV